MGSPQERAADVLAKQPPLDPDARFYWQAFHELASDRPLGISGQGLIPLSAIRLYAQDYGLTKDEFEAFKRVLMNVDHARQSLIERKRERAAKSSA